MAGILSSLQGAVGQGVLWGIMVLGIYITFRLMDIADLTVDGSFALGGSVCAALVAGKGMNPGAGPRGLSGSGHGGRSSDGNSSHSI